MGVPQSRRRKRCRPLRGRRLRRGQRGEQIVGGLRRRVVRAHSRHQERQLGGRCNGAQDARLGSFNHLAREGRPRPCRERTQIFRFAVRQVIGKRNFAAEAHAACARRLGAGRAAGVGAASHGAHGRMLQLTRRSDGCGQLAPIRTRQLFLQPPVRLGRPFHQARHLTEQDRSS